MYITTSPGAHDQSIARRDSNGVRISVHTQSLVSIRIIVVVGVIPGDTAKGEYSQAVSDNPFDASVWQPVDGFDLTDITYHRHVVDGDRSPRRGWLSIGPRCATRSGLTRVDELYRVIDHARMSPEIGVVLLDRQRPQPEGRRLGVLLRR